MPLPTFPPIGGNAHVFTRSVTGCNACQGNQSRLKGEKGWVKLRHQCPLGPLRTAYKPFSGAGVGNPTRKAQKAGLNPPRTAQNGLQAVFRGWGRQPYAPKAPKGPRRPNQGLVGGRLRGQGQTPTTQFPRDPLRAVTHAEEICKKSSGGGLGKPSKV